MALDRVDLIVVLREVMDHNFTTAPVVYRCELCGKEIDLGSGILDMLDSEAKFINFVKEIGRCSGAVK